jgi:hypothetical protein
LHARRAHAAAARLLVYTVHPYSHAGIMNLSDKLEILADAASQMDLWPELQAA